jgi:LysM repeat protein
MSALDVLSNIAYCENKGYEGFTPTSMVLNTTIHRAMVQRDMRSTTVCDPPAVYTVQQEDTCNGLCLARNISTHSLTASNFLHPYCGELPPAGTEICLPTSCDVYTVKKNDTLQSIADQQPGRVSIERLLAWNPHLLPLWNLKKQTGMQICVSPPANTSSIPTDLAPSSFTHCGKYYEVQPGDTCADITSKEVISLPNLISLNPDIETDCVAGERYCVLSVPYIKKTSTLRGAATPAA